MKKVKKVHFNWRMEGNMHDDIGEDYDVYEVGRNGVIQIIEHIPSNEPEQWNYEIESETGWSRIFNPNYVEYFKEGCF